VAPRKQISAIPYAFAVPVLVVMMQSAWVIRGWNFRNTLLAQLFYPPIFLGLCAAGIVSFFLIRPFARSAVGRWAAVLFCVAVVTFTYELFMPKLAE
jgi:hypothetical protein